MNTETKETPAVRLPAILRCSVCSMTLINHAGSTPCCGGLADYMYEDEVTALGFNVEQTRNKGHVRPKA